MSEYSDVVIVELVTTVTKLILFTFPILFARVLLSTVVKKCSLVSVL